MMRPWNAFKAVAIGQLVTAVSIAGFIIRLRGDVAHGGDQIAFVQVGAIVVLQREQMTTAEMTASTAALTDDACPPTTRTSARYI